jgi:hypothetical protein
MKKTITLLAILCVVNVFATDRFVDPNLSQGNGTTLFTSITDAVGAAQNGDRIIIASSIYNEDDLTIDKSIQVIPQTAGATINFNANILISGFAGMNLEIIGFNLGAYSINSNSGGSVTSLANINLINVEAYNINFDHNYLYPTIISSSIQHEIIIRNGNIIKTTTNKLFVYDEPGENEENNKILISNNTIGNLLQLFNNNKKIIVANNSLHDLFITDWNKNESIINEIINNLFLSKPPAGQNCDYDGINDGTNPRIHISVLGSVGSCCNYYSGSSVSRYNFIFSSNLFSSQPFFSSFESSSSYMDNYSTSQSKYFLRNQYNCGGSYLEFLNGWGFNNSDAAFPNNNSNGFFEWSYNGIDIPIDNSSANNLSFTTIICPTEATDGGNTNHKYYDIDLTINDRGINGGPYSQFNYNASNPNNSRAFIFDLDMPTDLFPGQDVQIKAKGYHKN